MTKPPTFLTPDNAQAQDLAHHRFLGVEHPEVPRRLAWIEAEMDTLSAELFDTRMDLENAAGAGWEHADPTWSDRAYRRPERPGPGVDDGVTAMVRGRVIERGGPEIDFDLGL